MKLRYRQELEQGWCECDDADYGPIVEVQIGPEDDEQLTAPLAQLQNAGEKYTIQRVRTCFGGRHDDA